MRGRDYKISIYRNKLVEMMADMELCDIWRVQHKGVKQYTWISPNGKIKSRIDFALVSQFLAPHVKTTRIDSSVKSDHRSVFLTLQGKTFKDRGPGFWKFNCALLGENEFINGMNTLLKDAKLKYENYGDKGLKWDAIKCEIRGFTIKYSKAKARRTRNRESLLLKELTYLENNTSDNEDTVNEEKVILKTELEEIVNTKTRGAMIRSKANWAENGEKSTKYFLGLEKRNYKNKCISILISHDGRTLTDSDDILKEEQHYFSRVYSTQKPSLSIKEIRRLKKVFLENPDITKLSDDDKIHCEGVLSLQECSRSLKEFKNNKSPGSDGLTAEFYKFFWKNISEFVVDSLNFAFDNNKLSADQQRGLITLVPKKDKDRCILKNWRPLSLLNMDYKIGTKALAKRIQNLLPILIEPDQTGYVKGRYIGENLRLISDILLLSNIRQFPGLLLLIDFEKAFDSIEWDYIDEALKAFDFGPDFRKWVKVFYCDSKSAVLNNGFASEWFNLERSVRQGCPLAPFLFVLAVELLAISIRRDREIKGISCGPLSVKISQLADDTTCFLADEASGFKLLDLLSDFAKLSGLKCNFEKTEVLWIGLDKHRPSGSLPVKWVTGKFKTLGIMFSLDETEMASTNIGTKLEQLKKTLNMWKMRNLTLIGRILVAKTLALSQITYVVTNVHTPALLTIDIQKIINSFVWKDSTPKVKLKIISQNIENGGLKYPVLIDQFKSLKLGFIRRLFDEENKPWKNSFQVFLKNISVKDLFLSRCVIADNLIINLPLFYKDLILFWSDLKKDIEPNNAQDICNEFLWFNPFITIDEQSIFYKKWYQQGIKYVADILESNGRLLMDNEIKVKFEI
jgi:hypothetical protein